MGLLDQLSGMAGGGGGGIGGALQDLLGGSQGGLDGLLAKFNQAGLGDLMSQWISTGPNPGISAGQLQQVLGSGQLQDLAARFGLPLDQLLGGLTQALPQTVDGMTPSGAIPAAGSGPNLTDLLGGLFGKG